PSPRGIVIFTGGNLLKSMAPVKGQRPRIGGTHLEQHRRQFPSQSFLLAMAYEGRAHALALRIRGDRNDQQVSEVRRKEGHAETDDAAMPARDPTAIARDRKSGVEGKDGEDE